MKFFRFLSFITSASVLLLTACGQNSDGNSSTQAIRTVNKFPVAKDCATRKNGAFITLQAFGHYDEFNRPLDPEKEDKITVWITDSTFIDAAIQFKNNGIKSMIPVFDKVIEGTDCDGQWSYHVDPASVSWAHMTNEECDASPGYIQKDVNAWVSRPNPNWCSWALAVKAVDDRRVKTNPDVKPENRQEKCGFLVAGGGNFIIALDDNILRERSLVAANESVRKALLGFEYKLVCVTAVWDPKEKSTKVLSPSDIRAK